MFDIEEIKKRDIGQFFKFKLKNGKEIQGRCIDIRKGNTLLNIKTGVENHDTVQLKIKPANGRAVWTQTVVPC